jgi:predicted HTH domain antitoxin
MKEGRRMQSQTETAQFPRSNRYDLERVFYDTDFLLSIVQQSFMDDYPAWMGLLGGGGGSQSGSGGEFLINLAIERYEVLSLMVSLNSMAPFLTLFQVSMILRDRNEELTSLARKTLAKDLDRLKEALRTYGRYL